MARLIVLALLLLFLLVASFVTGIGEFATVGVLGLFLLYVVLVGGIVAVLFLGLIRLARG